MHNFLCRNELNRQVKLISNGTGITVDEDISEVAYHLWYICIIGNGIKYLDCLPLDYNKTISLKRIDHYIALDSLCESVSNDSYVFLHLHVA